VLRAVSVCQPGVIASEIALSSLPVAFATVHPKEIDVSKLATLDLNIYTTSLFKLPAGGFGLAFGGQFRRETLTQEPDQLHVSGDILGGGPAFFTNAGRKTYAFYAEGYLPVFSPTFSAPGLYALEFTAAIRFEETQLAAPGFYDRLRAEWGQLTPRQQRGNTDHNQIDIELGRLGTTHVSAINEALERGIIDRLEARYALDVPLEHLPQLIVAARTRHQAYGPPR